MPYRIARARTRRGFYALLLAGMLASFAALGVVIATRLDVTTAACQQVNVLRIAIVESLHRSEATLPTLAYYRQHPAELAQQERLIVGELSRFHPVRC